jgi:hypothetical protein
MAASLRLKPSSAIGLPLILRFQTKELSMWINQKNAVSEEQQDSIQQIESRFKSDQLGQLISLPNS